MEQFLKQLFATGCIAASLLAQTPAAPPDTPEIVAKLAQIKAAAGAQWQSTFHFFCEAPRANADSDPEIAATQIFDNVYAIGNIGTTVYVVRTSAGLVMLDTLPANQLETQLLPGFRKLGLNPADVKMILVAHGHADHFGNSPYFQKTHDSRVYLSPTDWAVIEQPAAKGKQGPAIPRHDGELKDGQPITFGDAKFTPIDIPGHTPGSMGFAFTVKDGGVTRTAALFGGAWLTTGRLTPESIETFLKSIRHYRDSTRAAKADVVLQNHPLMMPFTDQLAALAARKPGQPNPFVQGEAGVQKFIDVMAGCTEIAGMRKKLP